MRVKHLMIGALVAAVAALFFRTADRDEALDSASATIEGLYDDRLVAAGYLYRLNDVLHRRLFLGTRSEEFERRSRVDSLNREMHLLMWNYSATVMTPEERSKFRELVAIVERLSATVDETDDAATRDVLISVADEGLSKIHELVGLQLKEGESLANSGQRAVSGWRVLDELEWSVLVVALLVFLLMLKKRRPLLLRGEGYSRN